MHRHSIVARGFAIVAVASILLLRAAPAEAQQPNPMLTKLLKTGVPFDQLGGRKLRAPTLADGLNAQQQQEALAPVLKLKQGQKLTYEHFCAEGLNAPHVLVIDDPNFAAGVPGHSIDLWFTVRGKLATVAAPGFLKNQFQADPKDKMVVLSKEDLAARQITPEKIEGGKESYAFGKFRVFPTDMRVVVQGVCRIVQTNNPSSIVLAGLMDSRFDQDAKMPNEWRPVIGANGGQPQLGSPTIYHSAGGYTKITELAEPAGALLVEYHFVYDEPQTWFNGNNLLRPKLIGQTPDDVRLFRRKLILSEQ